MNRREFLLSLVASVSATTIACGSDDGEADPKKVPVDDAGADAPAEKLTPNSAPAESDKVFPQGLASGDPRPDRVVLWTRVDPEGAGKKSGDVVDVVYIIARNEELTDIVARGSVPASAEADYTVRLLPTGLEAGKRYYYRFETGGTTTRVGRTKTAPSPDSNTPVMFAFASCQDYVGRYYHAWRALLEEKLDLDFVLFLGDYIYETVNDNRFQSEAGDRQIIIPDGIDVSSAQDKSRIAAGTLADYRAIYKQVRSDEHMKEVHRLYPFIITWDDHEFSNDCWADHSVYFCEKDPTTKAFTDEKSTKRRQDASRAWFEYQPVDVKFSPGASFPNDITIYRNLRYGKNVEVFMTDQRMYRDDHLVPEGPINLTVGKFVPNSEQGSRVLVRKSGFDTEEAKVKPTLLGKVQKDWFLDALKKSTATWKVWGNEVQVWQQAVDLGKIDGVPDIIKTKVYVSVDQWDGFRSERKEILQALSDAKVKNLVVCTGDIHSFYAAELQIDFDKPSLPVGVEYVTGAISSATLDVVIQKIAGGIDALKNVATALVDNIDDALMDTNPHLRYSASSANGFSVMTITEAKTEVTFYETSGVTVPEYKGVLGRTKFETLAGTNVVQKVV